MPYCTVQHVRNLNHHPHFCSLGWNDFTSVSTFTDPEAGYLMDNTAIFSASFHIIKESSTFNRTIERGLSKSRGRVKAGPGILVPTPVFWLFYLSHTDRIYPAVRFAIVTEQKPWQGQGWARYFRLQTGFFGSVPLPHRQDIPSYQVCNCDCAKAVAGSRPGQVSPFRTALSFWLFTSPTQTGYTQLSGLQL